MLSTLLVLADGRFPAGSHAHSGGLEEAVASGRVHDEASLYSFLAGRLASLGSVEAGLAAAACAAQDREALEYLNAEAVARCPSPALRQASRALGRGLLRAYNAVWGGGPVSSAKPENLMHPIALGFVCAQAGLEPKQAALLAAQSSVTAPGWAATRLLGLDPYAVVRCLVGLAREVEAVADRAACGATDGPPANLAAFSCPLVEIGSAAHAGWEVRLFGS